MDCFLGNDNDRDYNKKNDNNDSKMMMRSNNCNIIVIIIITDICIDLITSPALKLLHKYYNNIHIH